MAKTRERQRGTQYTGILRSTNREERPVAPSQIEEKRGFNWRIVSGIIVFLLAAILFLFFYSDAFYVTSVRVGGVDTMTVEEVFAFADIANWHVFWLRPELVRENIMANSPSIADVQVQINWPPNMVTISIQEREPALIWEQNGLAFWVDIQGNLMNMRSQRVNLVRVIVDDPTLELPVGTNQVDLEIVYGLLQLHEIRPQIPEWRYRPDKGLGFRNENGWDVWLGIGTDMEEKMQIYETLASDIIARGIQPGELNIVNPDAPYYTVLWGRDE